MAGKRGKSQARRNGGGGNGSIPGWAWLVLGILLTVVVMIVGSKYLRSEGGDGFLRVQPNPDAQPVPVAEDEDAVAPEGNPTAAKADEDRKGRDDEYDFYTLLPGKEVPLSDAEIAATERAEAERAAARARQAADAPAAPGPDTSAADALPRPVDDEEAAAPAQAATAAPGPAPATAATTPAPPARPATVSADDGTRYLLQAGAFQASGQAEELKARIALLGLGARVESAQIGAKTVYRVRMGPYGTAGDLADAKRKLSAGGLAAMAIKVQ